MEAEGLSGLRRPGLHEGGAGPRSGRNTGVLGGARDLARRVCADVCVLFCLGAETKTHRAAATAGEPVAAAGGVERAAAAAAVIALLSRWSELLRLCILHLLRQA